MIGEYIGKSGKGWRSARWTRILAMKYEHLKREQLYPSDEEMFAIAQSQRQGYPTVDATAVSQNDVTFDRASSEQPRSQLHQSVLLSKRHPDAGAARHPVSHGKVEH